MAKKKGKKPAGMPMHDPGMDKMMMMDQAKMAGVDMKNMPKKSKKKKGK